jgi:hypothetical protein
MMTTLMRVFLGKPGQPDQWHDGTCACPQCAACVTLAQAGWCAKQDAPKDAQAFAAWVEQHL